MTASGTDSTVSGSVGRLKPRPPPAGSEAQQYDGQSKKIESHAKFLEILRRGRRIGTLLA